MLRRAVAAGRRPVVLLLAVASIGGPFSASDQAAASLSDICSTYSWFGSTHSSASASSGEPHGSVLIPYPYCSANSRVPHSTSRSSELMLPPLLSAGV